MTIKPGEWSYWQMSNSNFSRLDTDRQFIVSGDVAATASNNCHRRRHHHYYFIVPCVILVVVVIVVRMLSFQSLIHIRCLTNAFGQ